MAAAESATVRPSAPTALHGLLEQEAVKAVKAVAAREQDFVMGEVLAKDDLDERLLKAELRQHAR